jgi:hypothetical protein
MFSGCGTKPSPCHMLPQAVAAVGRAVLGRLSGKCCAAPRLFRPGLGAQQPLPPAPPRTRGVAARENCGRVLTCWQGLTAPLS